MDTKPKVSIAIPVHDMENGDWFLSRLLNSLQKQTFRNFEIVITKKGKMAENTNAAMKSSRGELIKILYMDDYLAHENSLMDMIAAFTPQTKWLATGCMHDNGQSVEGYHSPSFDGVWNNINTIGSPSVIMLRNGLNTFFDETMSWLLDVDWYKRMDQMFGQPVLLDSSSVIIGIGNHQMTYILTNEEKEAEVNYLNKKDA